MIGDRKEVIPGIIISHLSEISEGRTARNQVHAMGEFYVSTGLFYYWLLCLWLPFIYLFIFCRKLASHFLERDEEWQQIRMLSLAMMKKKKKEGRRNKASGVS